MNSICRLSQLKQLEAESIHIFRDAISQFENPVLLYSIGKDSSVLVHLAKKAFYPGTPIQASSYRLHIQIPRDDRIPGQIRSGK